MRVIEFHRILCPINFADSSPRTVEGASSLAAMYDAELRLFYVVSARTGDPSSEITQHARLTGSDLIVLGTDRRSAPAEVRTSIVADVAAHAPCPVLHVRPHLLQSLSDIVMVHASCPVLIVPPSSNASHIQADHLRAREAKGLSR